MRPVAAVVVLMLLQLPAPAAQPRPDFSGLWTMDEERSATAGQAGFTGPVTWHISQAAGEMKVEIRRASKVFTVTYVIDERSPNAAGDRSGAGSPGYRGYWDGAALITETTQTIQGQTVTTREVRTLEKGGREMLIERTVNVHHGYSGRGAQSSNTAKDVFVRSAP